MHHKHLIIAVISDLVLLNHVAQSKNVGNHFLIVPPVHMISQHDCMFVHSMVPPLLFSCMLWLDLKVDSTRAGSWIRSIVDWLSKSITFLKSSLILVPCICLKSFAIHSSNSIAIHFTPICVNWNPSSNWKCKSSSSDSESDKSESCMLVIWGCVKAFFRFLVSLASFLTLCTMLVLSLLLATACFLQLNDGCRFSL